MKKKMKSEEKLLKFTKTEQSAEKRVFSTLIIIIISVER